MDVCTEYVCMYGVCRAMYVWSMYGLDGCMYGVCVDVWMHARLYVDG